MDPKNMLHEKINKYNSPLKTVGGHKGNICLYPTRLDTYGKGCYFNCKYCYAKSLLGFRGLWSSEDPAPADINQIIEIINKTPSNNIFRLGGMTDCFQPKESIHRVTYKTIRLLNKKHIHYLIVTKNNMIIRPEYLKILDPELAHIQVSIPSTEDHILNYTDNAPSFEDRKKTVEVLYDHDFDISVRLSPYLYNPYFDYDKFNDIQCDKLLIEFLRINKNIINNLKFILNPHEYKVKANNYLHLSLKKKIALIKPFKFKEMSVCDSVDDHYNYFRNNFNFNPYDCCNLRLK